MGKLAKTVVHGTPVNFVGPAGALIGGREGYSPGKPAGNERSTVNEQYASDNRGYQPNPNGGTPYHSQLGNPDETRRVAQDGGYGRVISEGGQDHADPKSNGSGTIFDGAKQGNGYTVKPNAPQLDSPVPRNAPRFEPSFIEAEDRAHLGSGNEGAADSLVKGGGVMGR